MADEESIGGGAVSSLTKLLSDDSSSTFQLLLELRVKLEAAQEEKDSSFLRAIV